MAFIVRDPKTRKKTSKNIEPKEISDIFEDAKNKGISTRPFDIERYISTIDDIEIIREQMADDKLSGYIEKRNDKYTIGINKYHHIHRQRFTMAHEFAHYNKDKEFLEKNKKHYEEIFFETLYTSNLISVPVVGLQRGEFDIKAIEVQANIFASQLLIPEFELRKKIEDLNEQEKRDQIEILAEYFKVSPAAIDYRLKTMR